MNKDKCVIIILAITILINISVWIAGLIKHKLVPWFSYLNVLTGFIVITYWIAREIKITQHFIENGEIAVLSFEVLVIAVSVYTISSASLNNWLKITQYIVFALHFTCLILFLVFILTFKLDKLI
ncbi:MAG: hypothetical protein ACRDE5_10365 [Ginsengibacter sp.]